jgi:hypothetical protein
MAGQRRGEPGGLRGRGLPRLGGLALALSLLLTAGCGDGGPTGTDRHLGGDGTTGGPSGAELLVGTWRTVLVVEVPGDVQTWTTTWHFDADGACHQTVVTESLAEGWPRVSERDCTYEAGDFEVVIAFDDGGVLEVEYGFADFSPDRLLLDGFEYQRLA